MKTIHAMFILALAGLLGCEKSADSPAALASANGLMPGAMPSYEDAYVADQAQVKTAPKRTVSYEPLENFKGGDGAKTKEAAEQPGKKPAKKTEAKKQATPTKASKTAAPKVAPAASPQAGAAPSGEGFWKRLGTNALGGAAAAGSANQKPTEKKASAQSGKTKPESGKSKPAASDSKKAAEDDEADEDSGDEDAEEEGDDAEEESSDDEEGGG